MHPSCCAASLWFHSAFSPALFHAAQRRATGMCQRWWPLACAYRRLTTGRLFRCLTPQARISAPARLVFRLLPLDLSFAHRKPSLPVALLCGAAGAKVPNFWAVPFSAQPWNIAYTLSSSSTAAHHLVPTFSRASTEPRCRQLKRARMTPRTCAPPSEGCQPIEPTQIPPFFRCDGPSFPASLALFRMTCLPRLQQALPLSCLPTRPLPYRYRASCAATITAFERMWTPCSAEVGAAEANIRAGRGAGAAQ